MHGEVGGGGVRGGGGEKAGLEVRFKQMFQGLQFAKHVVFKMAGFLFEPCLPR